MNDPTLPISPSPEPPVTPGTVRFVGFDTSIYPGDHSMAVWKSQSPFSFVGYYLKAPCHAHSSWVGARAKLQAAQWGLAVLYVGRQQQGPCSGSPVSAAIGHADGVDAVKQCSNEGFVPNTVAFLDVEHMDTIPQAMSDYVTAWFQAVSTSEFVPGMYCHVKNAAALRAAAMQGYPAEKPQPKFWVAGGKGFDMSSSVPTDSGIAFANLWQGQLDTRQTYGGITIGIDVEVGDSGDPSAIYVGVPALSLVQAPAAPLSASGPQSLDDVSHIIPRNPAGWKPGRKSER